MAHHLEAMDPPPLAVDLSIVFQGAHPAVEDMEVALADLVGVTKDMVGKRDHLGEDKEKLMERRVDHGETLSGHQDAVVLEDLLVTVHQEVLVLHLQEEVMEILEVAADK